MSSKTTKKKIVIVSNSTRYNYNFRLGLLRSLKSLGFEVIIISPKDHYSSKLISEGFQFHHLPFEIYNTNPIVELKAIFQLAKIYNQIQPDLIFHYTAKPNIYGSIAAWWCKTPSIAITTGLGVLRTPGAKKSKRVLQTLYRLACRLSHQVWFLNQEDVNFFLERKMINPKKVRLLPSEGVDITWYRPRFNQRKNGYKTKFLYAGRIVRSKGLMEYYEAAANIRQNRKDVIFQMIGFIVPEHPDGISFNQIQKWQQSKVIQYLGETDDIRSYLEAADCVVLPSYHEGVSRVLLEAASMAKPIIATDVVGCREVVEHGVNGLLCEAKNTLDLIDKLELFLDLPMKERDLMGLAGRKKVIEQFDENIVIEHYLNAIHTLLPSSISPKKVRQNLASKPF